MSSLTFPSTTAADTSILKPRDTTAGTTSTTSSTDTSSQTSLSSLGTTFMQLLVQELQNQDPTAPMDSTQMVGQMISLNQLDQVASINQLLTNTLGASTGAASTTGITSSTGTTSTTPSNQAQLLTHN